MKMRFQRIYTTFTENMGKKCPFNRPNVVEIREKSHFIRHFFCFFHFMSYKSDFTSFSYSIFDCEKTDSMRMSYKNIAFHFSYDIIIQAKEYTLYLRILPVYNRCRYCSPCCKYKSGYRPDDPGLIPVIMWQTDCQIYGSCKNPVCSGQGSENPLLPCFASASILTFFE